MRKLESTLQRKFSRDLQTPVALCFGSPPGTSEEQPVPQATRFPSTERRLAWLRGRLVLKELAERVSLTVDPFAAVFPNKECSISHTQELTIAMAINGGDTAIVNGNNRDSAILGLGIDIETARCIDPRSMRFYLSAAEMLKHHQSDEATLLRLWTIKEALFKADPDNNRRFFADYKLFEPAAFSGVAYVAGDRSKVWRYTSARFDAIFIAAAVCRQTVNSRNAGAQC